MFKTTQIRKNEINFILQKNKLKNFKNQQSDCEYLYKFIYNLQNTLYKKKYIIFKSENNQKIKILFINFLKSYSYLKSFKIVKFLNQSLLL